MLAGCADRLRARGIDADAAIAGAAENLAKWRAYAAEINAAFAVDPVADAALDALMAKHSNHATRPITRRTP